MLRICFNKSPFISKYVKTCKFFNLQIFDGVRGPEQYLKSFQFPVNWCRIRCRKFCNSPISQGRISTFVSPMSKVSRFWSRPTDFGSSLTRVPLKFKYLKLINLNSSSGKSSIGASYKSRTLNILLPKGNVFNILLKTRKERSFGILVNDLTSPSVL